MNGSFSTSICADCGVQDPSWASINRGVLLCNDCCSVHRSLGRHISHVRSLQAANWPPVLKETVFTLVKKGSNSLWEHVIHDNSHHHKIKVKKPSLKDPKDKQNASRQEFITCKYKSLMFLPRLSMKDHVNSIEDLSKQLHASVRTNNLETCLRLISLGADPNYKHSERGNTPLHVAAQAGQAMQVELLVVHGANPSLLDRLGHTPEECARIAGHHQLADRLIECQYELTDKLSFYLSGRTPVHSIGEHFLVPQGVGNVKNMAEARSRLQELSNELFEELAADIYDEVDRRETDAMWLTTQQLQSSVAFLPVNPTLSPLRNQSRQKLALLNSSEFTQLLVDMLLDAKRRQQISVETGQTSGTVVPSTSEDKTAVFDPHDYDEVPVDDTKSPTTPPQLKPEIQAKIHIPPPPSYPRPNPPSQAQPRPAPPTMSRQGHPAHSRPPAPAPYRGVRTGNKSASMFVPGPSATLYSDAYSTVEDTNDNQLGGDGDYAEVNELPKKEIHSTETEGSEPVSKAKFNLVMERLRKVTAEKDELEAANHALEEKVASLQTQLANASEENARLRSSTSRSPPPPSPSTLAPIVEPSDETEESSAPEEPHLYAQVDYNKKTSRKSSAASRLSGQEQVPQPERILEDLYAVPDKKKSSSSDTPTMITPPPPRQDTPLSDSAFEESSEAVPVGTNPPIDLVHSHIKTLTQVIQDLLKAAQGHKQTHFSPCSLKIGRAVDSLTRIFPTKPGSQAVQVSLQEVKNAAQRLQTECQDGSQTDMAYRTRQIISSAYDVAKAARHLVMCVEQDIKSKE